MGVPTAHPNKGPIDVMFGDAQADHGVGFMSKLSFSFFFQVEVPCTLMRASVILVGVFNG